MDHVFGLALEERDDLAPVGVRTVLDEEVGEPGHSHAEQSPGFVGPRFMDRAPAHTHDLQARQVAGGLEAGGHHQDVGEVLVAVDVDHPLLGHGLDGTRDEFHVVPQEGRIERRVEDGPLARIRVLGRDGLGQIGSVHEHPLYEGTALLLA